MRLSKLGIRLLDHRWANVLEMSGVWGILGLEFVTPRRARRHAREVRFVNKLLQIESWNAGLLGSCVLNRSDFTYEDKAANPSGRLSRPCIRYCTRRRIVVNPWQFSKHIPSPDEVLRTARSWRTRKARLLESSWSRSKLHTKTDKTV